MEELGLIQIECIDSTRLGGNLALPIQTMDTNYSSKNICYRVISPKVIYMSTI